MEAAHGEAFVAARRVASVPNKMNVQSFAPSLKKALVSHLKNGQLTFASVVLIACTAVEEYNEHSGELAGADKKKWASVLIPEVISESVHNGYISRDQGDALLNQLTIAADVISSVIDAYVAIANSPALLQVQEAVRSCCAMLKSSRK